ncbi:hypothetical protein FM113_05300 [Leucobacter sp. 7(1)]|nr:hypothetical protein FM113_05300 [Leucobacter sp. 7(1)]
MAARRDRVMRQGYRPHPPEKLVLALGSTSRIGWFTVVHQPGKEQVMQKINRIAFDLPRPGISLTGH